MKRILCVLVLCAIAGIGSVAQASATHAWAGPGWYQVFDMIGSKSLGAGPFTGETACKEKLPPDDVGRFECVYFQQDPGLEPFG